jgi:hypothetical protein
MLMSDLVRALRDGGIDVRHWHVRHLIAAGLVGPPQRDSTGRFLFTSDDYALIRRRLEARMGPGRRRGRTAWASDKRRGQVSSSVTESRTATT